MNGILRNLILAAALTAAPVLAFAQEGGEEKGGEQKAEGPDNKAKAQMFVEQGQKFMSSFQQSRNQNEFMMARQCFVKALELDKTNFDALLGVSEMMMLEANTGAAAAKLTEAVKVKPKHQKAQYLLGSVLLKLERYEKAVEALKAAYEADEGLVQDAETQVMIPFEYGKCLARMGKAEEGAKVLRELAEGGKFEIFGSYKDARQNLYFEGYQMVGEAYMGMGQYQEADRFLTKAVANCKQLHEGKLTAELQSAYVYNKFRVPIPSVGQMEGDVFLHVASKLKIQKPKNWFFCFPHPECYNDENSYKQKSQSYGIWVWNLEKNKERQWDVKISVEIDVWGMGGLNMGGVSVDLGNPKNVAEVNLENIKKYLKPVVDRKNPPAAVAKFKFNGMSACGWKGLFSHPENDKVRYEKEFVCFVTSANCFWLEINGDEGCLKTYAKEIDLIKKSIVVQK